MNSIRKEEIFVSEENFSIEGTHDLLVSKGGVPSDNKTSSLNDLKNLINSMNKIRSVDIETNSDGTTTQVMCPAHNDIEISEYDKFNSLREFNDKANDITPYLDTYKIRGDITYHKVTECTCENNVVLADTTYDYTEPSCECNKAYKDVEYCSCNERTSSYGTTTCTCNTKSDKDTNFGYYCSARVSTTATCGCNSRTGEKTETVLLCSCESDTHGVVVCSNVKVAYQKSFYCTANNEYTASYYDQNTCYATVQKSTTYPPSDSNCGYEFDSSSNVFAKYYKECYCNTDGSYRVKTGTAYACTCNAVRYTPAQGSPIACPSRTRFSSNPYGTYGACACNGKVGYCKTNQFSYIEKDESTVWCSSRDIVYVCKGVLPKPGDACYCNSEEGFKVCKTRTANSYYSGSNHCKTTLKGCSCVTRNESCDNRGATCSDVNYSTSEKRGYTYDIYEDKPYYYYRVDIGTRVYCKSHYCSCKSNTKKCNCNTETDYTYTTTYTKNTDTYPSTKTYTYDDYYYYYTDSAYITTCSSRIASTYSTYVSYDDVKDQQYSFKKESYVSCASRTTPKVHYCVCNGNITTDYYVYYNAVESACTCNEVKFFTSESDKKPTSNSELIKMYPKFAEERGLSTEEGKEK
jgi:hypothetical protein